MNPEMYAFFVQDVGTEGYSRAGLNDVPAKSPSEAIAKRVPRNFGWKTIALPVNRRELWPDGKTGLLSDASKVFLGEVLK